MPNPAIRSLILAACVVALIHAAASEPFSQNTDIKSELQQRFKGKTFLIQNGYQGEDLTYDSSGTVIGAPRRGPWTGSAVKIRSIKVRRHEFILQGNRGGFAYDHDAKKFVPLIAKKYETTITVRADPATLTSANLDALQHAIFAEDANSVDHLPEYWRDFLAHGEQDLKTYQADLSRPAEVIPGFESNSQPVFRIGKGIIPPRVLNQREPEFSEASRQARYQGTVVLRTIIDDQGMPTQIKIARALGMGLDDAAVDALEQWRFAPAKLDGKPVAAIVDIEMNFKLF